MSNKDSLKFKNPKEMEIVRAALMILNSYGLDIKVFKSEVKANQRVDDAKEAKENLERKPPSGIKGRAFEMTKSLSKDRNFGGQLKKIRLLLGLSQSDLAELVRCSQASISIWEKGRFLPSQRSVFKIKDCISKEIERRFCDK